MPHFARDARDSAARWRSGRRGGGRGRAAGGGGGAAVRLRTFAIERAPRASTLSLTSTRPTSSLTKLVSSPLQTTHRTGTRPFTSPLVTAHRWRWCRRSSRRTRRPPRRRPLYAALPPLAACIRGPQRSSEVLIGNQGQSGVIIRTQRALSGTQRYSVATRRACSGLQRGPSEALSGPLGGHQGYSVAHPRYSEVLRGTQRSSETNQRSSETTQRHSEAHQRALSTRCTTPLARHTP